MATGNIISISINQTLLWKVRNFPNNVYNFDPQDNLTSLMKILLGNAGIGQLSALQVAARINQQNLEFSDLDNIMGTMLNTPRLSSEMYSTNTNPFIDQLTPINWDDVLTKDSDYRERLNGVAFSYLRGSTPFGLQSIAESTSGMKFRAIEVWNTTLSGTTISGTNIQTRGFGNNETVLLPLVPSNLNFTQALKLNVLNSLYNLNTTGSMVTVASGSNPFVQAPYSIVSGTNNFTSSGTYTITSGNSQYFTLNRQVTANNINTPSYVNSSLDLSITGRYWLVNNTKVQAPQFAHLETQEALIDVTQNISTMNVTPISSIGSPSTYTVNAPTSSATLSITSTAYGSQ